MSKRAKSDAKKRRASLKRSRKASMQAQYQKWRDDGANNKSKRNRLKNRRLAAIRTTKHKEGPCGNIGCKMCNPTDYNLLPNWMRVVQRTAA